MSNVDRHPIAILGDFSGNSVNPVTKRRFIAVDRDTIDQAIHLVRPSIELHLPYCHSLTISKWVDFHPDQIVQRVPSLKALLYAREEVGNPPAMRQHLAEAGASSDIDTEPAVSGEDANASVSNESAPADDDLLDSILGGSPTLGQSPTSSVSARPSKVESKFDRMVRAIVEETSSGADFAREDARRAAIDEELALRLRGILHHPAFQAVEANWTGARNIVRAGDATAVRLLDIRAGEVTAEAEAFLGLLEVSSGEERHQFSHLLCNLEVTSHAEGLALCRLLSGFGAACGAAVVANVQPSALFDGAVLDQQLRQQVVEMSADNLALAYPQVLLRLPYGEETEEIEEFEFEEFAAAPEPNQYLWGGAAFALGAALSGWRENGGPFGEIPSLPIHVYRAGTETQSTGPVAEMLYEGRINGLNEAGVTCIVGVAGGDSAHVVGLRSLGGSSLLGD